MCEQPIERLPVPSMVPRPQHWRQRTPPVIVPSDLYRMPRRLSWKTTGTGELSSAVDRAVYRTLSHTDEPNRRIV